MQTLGESDRYAVRKDGAGGIYIQGKLQVATSAYLHIEDAIGFECIMEAMLLSGTPTAEAIDLTCALYESYMEADNVLRDPKAYAAR